MDFVLKTSRSYRRKIFFTSMYDFVKYDRLPGDLAMSKRMQTHHQHYIIWNRTLCHVKNNNKEMNNINKYVFQLNLGHRLCKFIMI